MTDKKWERDALTASFESIERMRQDRQKTRNLLRRCCVYLRRANGLNPTESGSMVADIQAALEGE